MKLSTAPFALALSVVILASAARPARATIVERVVAVIGERPILWTELVHRALSGRLQIRMQTHDANVISVQEQEMYKELLDRMIDDRMEQQQADRAHMSVSPEEIDRGISNIATQAQEQQGRPVTAANILAEVENRGLTQQDFREEIRRQILEGKLIELRVRPRVHVTDEDARAAYQHWVKEMGDREMMDVRVLALRLQPTWTQPQRDARMALAEELVRRARSGEDFCKLVSQYTDDVATKGSCGSRGAQPFGSLIPKIQEITRATKTGKVSDPVEINLGQDDAIVILMPLGQSRIPSFDEVKSDMTQKALIDGLDRARKQWLKELRRNVYIDVRL